MSRYSLAIFDFDGTLADSWRLMGRAIVEAADRFGYRSPSPEEAEQLRGLDNRAVMKALGVRMWQLPAIATHMRAVSAAQAHEVKLFEGIDTMVQALSDGGVRVAIVSSNAEATIRLVLGPDLAGRVSAYACGASLFGKARKFTRVVHRLGVEPSQAIAIGDEGRDIEAARAAGVASGAVTWGYATRDLLVSCRPTHVFDTCDQVVQTLTGRR
jgi:phosphoglycolate phosphatase